MRSNVSSSSSPIFRLHEPAHYLAAIVESSDDAIISKDLNGTITSWNASAERIFGYTADEAIGSPITLIIPDSHLAEEMEIMAKIKSGEHIDHIETVRVAKDRHLITLSITISPIRDDEGKIIGMSKVARDITARKAMEEELRQTNLNLECARQEMEDIIHIISHDLKEPIRALIQLSTLFKEDYGERLGTDGLEKVNRMADLSIRSHRLIDDLLQLSRLGKREIVLEKINTGEIIKDITKMLEVCLKERNARIVVPRPLPPLKGDKTIITEVMRNLITNAITYNDKDEPLVEIGFLDETEASREHVEYVFYVKDNGIGVSPEFQKEVFRLFKRLPTSAQYNPSGTGAGLALIKRLIERCNGRIWFESEPHKGSTFYFTAGKCTVPDLSAGKVK